MLGLEAADAPAREDGGHGIHGFSLTGVKALRRLDRLSAEKDL
jgi:hypothetical protein